MTGEIDAAEAALRERMRAADHAQLFVEDRVQLRIASAPGGRIERSSIRISGAAAHDVGRFHVSDPGLLDLPPIRSAQPELPVEEWVDLVTAIASEDVDVRLVAFSQRIWVANGDAVQTDTRRAARLEVRSSDDPSVTIDVVIPFGPHSTIGLGARVRERAEERRRSVPVDPSRDGACLVFAAGVAGIVAHELVGHALEGDAVARGSLLARAGDFRGAGALRVIDDPALGRAPWSVDDEGVAPRAVTLLEQGRVSGSLSTGHGRRASYLDPVLPRMGCTYIDRGDHDAEEILRETRRGTLVRRLVAGHADPVSGRATFIVTDADRIEDGRITRPLEPFVVVLDVLDALASIDRVAADLEFDTCIGSCVRAGQPLAVSVGAPTVRLGLVKVVV